MTDTTQPVPPGPSRTAGGRLARVPAAAPAGTIDVTLTSAISSSSSRRVGTV
ncbi:MAG TPA: hypothetical protein VIM18_13245 [Solirubrobacteraceae bacterium]